VSQLARVGDRVLASVHHGGAGELKALDWDTGAVRGQQWFDGPIDELVVQRGAVWALEGEPARLVRLDRKTLDPTSSPLRLPVERASALAAGDGYLWVTAPDAHELLRVDPVTQTLKYVPVDGTPVGIAFSGSSVWFADRASGVVRRIDPGSLRPVGDPIRVGKTPSALAATAGTVFVVDEDGTVRRIDVGSGRTLGEPISIGRGLSFSPAGRSLWVGGSASSTLDRIDAGASRGGDVVLRVSGMNDGHRADQARDGTTVTARGRFTASGAISGRGRVLVSRVENGPLITIRYVVLGRKGTITFVVKVDNNAGTSRWTVASATKAFSGLRGQGIDTPSADYTVDVLTGTVSR
jgi:sugar lactone lactonase YvrE